VKVDINQFFLRVVATSAFLLVNYNNDNNYYNNYKNNYCYTTWCGITKYPQKLFTIF